MNNPLVSIIIPIYNVEQYLNQCIQSVIKQTYTNLEILLIDDGSSDKSGEIADTWAKRDKRIKVIHQKNGGLSAARNAGLDDCHGEWIAFIDSDDYVSFNYIKEMLISAYANDTKLVNCGYVEVDSTSNRLITPNVKLISGVYSSNQYWKKYYQSKLPFFLITAWDKLYHKSIFEKIRYKNGILNEDEEVIYSIIKKARQISIIKDKLYYYRINRNDSIMKSLEHDSQINIDLFNIINNRTKILISDREYEIAELCNKEAYFLLLNKYTMYPTRYNRKIFSDKLIEIKHNQTYLKKCGVSSSIKMKVLLRFPFLIFCLKRIKWKMKNVN